MNRPPDPRRLLDAHAAATEFFTSHLLDEPKAAAYLRSRGIVAASAHAAPWTIGYAPRGWTHLRDHLRATGFTDEELLTAGLVSTASNGNVIDTFRDRVMFPIRNVGGQVVAFTGRDLSGQRSTPKYRNSITTPIYSKKQLLYGLAEQLGGDTEPEAVMLVEGPADVVAMARLRHPGTAQQPYVAVAPCGTALTAQQAALLAETVPPGTALVVAFDADQAGTGAADKAYRLLKNWPGPVEAIALPDGADPASLVAQHRADAVRVLQQARGPLVDLVLEHLLQPHLARFDARLRELARFGRDPALESLQIRLDAVRAVAPLVFNVGERDPAAAARLTHQLAVRLNLNPLSIFDAIYPLEYPSPTAGTEVRPRPAQPGRSATTRAAAAAAPHPPIALGAAGFPDPDLVAHEYARSCPPGAPAAMWVQHDPATGHVAWVVAEGVDDAAGDRDAAQLAAQVAGQVAVLVGARPAVLIARAALNAHFAQSGTGRGDATIAVVTSFDGDRPIPGQGRFSVAWAGDTRAYGTTTRGFAMLSVDHTLHAQLTRHDPAAPRRVGDTALTSSVRHGPVGLNRIDVSLTQIVLVGRALQRVDAALLRQAIDSARPRRIIQRLAHLGGPAAVALAIRPRPGEAHPVGTAPQLARLDTASSVVSGPRALPGRPRRLSLPAAPRQRAAPTH